MKKVLISIVLGFTVCSLPAANALTDDSLKFSGYLFIYFTGNSGNQEAIRFALSKDGYNYKALNHNQPVIASDTISAMGGVRDPYIRRSNDGKTFYITATDMKSALGWDSNHGIVMLKSQDLIHWTHSKVDIKTKFKEFSTINRAWAPETIYDPDKNKYMVYWSMRSGSNKDVIYYSYANDDFTDLETVPAVLFNYPTSTIDGDIIYKDGQYHLFFKTEGNGNGIKKLVSDSLTSGYTLYNKYLQQTSYPVEGSCVFKLNDSDTYIFMYDLYTIGKYQFTKSTDLVNFTVVDSQVSMDFSPRHGAVMSITADEYNLLNRTWGDATNIPPVQSSDCKFYPNPVKDILYVDCELPDAQAQVLNLSGQTLIKKSLSGENFVDCSSLKAGIYLLNIVTEDWNSVFKFVKK